MADEEYNEIFIAVGTALHNWSRVEGTLTTVLWRFMQTKNPAPATIVWGNIISLAPKLTIVSQMLPLLISDPTAQALWFKISDAVAKRNRSRNQLAHYEIVRFEDGYRLVSKYQSADMGTLGHADTNKDNVEERFLKAFETRGYRALEITQIAENFAELKAAIVWYTDWVIEFKRVPFELDSEPPQMIRDFLSKLPTTGAPPA